MSHRCLASGGGLLTSNNSNVPDGVVVGPELDCLFSESTFARFVVFSIDSVLMFPGQVFLAVCRPVLGRLKCQSQVPMCLIQWQ